MYKNGFLTEVITNVVIDDIFFILGEKAGTSLTDLYAENTLKLQASPFQKLLKKLFLQKFK